MMNYMDCAEIAKAYYTDAFGQISRDRDVYLFGAGSAFAEFMAVVKNEVKIKGVFDNDIGKIGTEIEGFYVLGAEELKKLDPEKSVIVIACNYYDELKAQLEGYGIKYIFYYVLLQEKMMNKSYGFFGNYRSWEEAERDSTGYDAECIFNKVKHSTEMALRGEALFERDSIAFHEEDYNYKLLAALLFIAKMENGLSVIDFGGSLGSTYHQNKKIFHQIGNVDWHIVEQDHYVQYGKKCNGGGASFHYDIEECSMEPVNCLLLSGSLQYVNRPYEYVERFLDKGYKYILFDRTPMFDEQDRIVVQKVHPNIYDASFPIWIFNRKRLHEKMMSIYNLLWDWESAENIHIDDRKLKAIQHYGMLYVLKPKEA